MRSTINSILSKLTGHHLSRSNTNKVEELFSSSWFKSLAIQTVIDAGANAGQFAAAVRKVMPAVTIYSFEPIPFEYDLLKKQFVGDDNFKGFKLALGDKKETAVFRLNKFSPSSSLLNFTENQKEYYPETSGSKDIEVEIQRLDSVLKNESLGETLLKIDVQGFEDKVILGSESILDKVKVIYVECSFKKFYEGQPLFNDINLLLTAKGFSFRGVGDQLNGGSTSEPLQIDAIFIKTE